MKYALIFFLFFLLGFLGTILYKKYSVIQQTTQVQTPLSKEKPFSLNVPPTQSIQGKILAMSGDIQWQSRSASVPALFLTPRRVLQGEEYWTGKNGKLEILFPSALQLVVSPDSHINLIQLLPANIVVGQSTGSIRYKKLSPTTPVGIRANNLLIQQHTGDVEINFDDDDPLIVVNVFKGSATVAFNNSENISTVIAIDEDSTFTYDYEKREGEQTTTE